MSGPSTVTCPCCGSAKVHNGWEGTPADWHTCDCGAGWYESRRAPAAGDAMQRELAEAIKFIEAYNEQAEAWLAKMTAHHGGD